MATVDAVIKFWLAHNMHNEPRDYADGSKLQGTPRISFRGPVIFTYKQPLASIIRRPHSSSKPLLLLWGSDTSVTSDRHRREVWWRAQLFVSSDPTYLLDWVAIAADRVHRFAETFDAFSLTESPLHPTLVKYNPYAPSRLKHQPLLPALERFHEANIRAYKEAEDHKFGQLCRARKQGTRMEYMKDHARIQLEAERYRAYAAEDLRYYALNSEDNHNG